MITFLFTSDYIFYLYFYLIFLDALQKFPIKVKKNAFNKRQEQDSLFFFGSDEMFYKEKKIIFFVIAINVLILEQWKPK